MSICEISEDSWRGISIVQSEVYPERFVENTGVLKSKWKASPKTCFVFKNDDDAISGYLLAHPWNSNKPPRLFEKLPQEFTGEILYLHDLAVRKDARGLGVGKKLYQMLLEVAKAQEFKSVMLVAVQGAENYWFKLGFLEMSNESSCLGYGKSSKLMILDIRT